MKITLDHNCIIHLENRTNIGKKVEAIVHDGRNQCFVVNVGASEMREQGVRPDQYGKFEELLEKAGIAHLPRLHPLMIWDVTFWDRCLWADEKMIKLSDAIRDALFGNSPSVDIATVGLDSLAGKKWLNQECDVLGMWCHIQNGNEVLLTTDSNFTKETKLPKLIALGAGRICHPWDL
jgi:hypothetical protein